MTLHTNKMTATFSRTWGCWRLTVVDEAGGDEDHDLDSRDPDASCGAVAADIRALALDVSGTVVVLRSDGTRRGTITLQRGAATSWSST